MIARAILLVSTISWSVGVHTVSAQTDVWTSLGPDGGSVVALAIDPETPTTLYAGTSNGRLFKTTNGGDTWSALKPRSLSEWRTGLTEHEA